MVKLFLVLMVGCFGVIQSSFLKNNEMNKYETSFLTVAKYSAYHSVVVQEEEETLIYFNQEKVLLYFHQGWNQIESISPQFISVVTFNSLNDVEEKNNPDGVEIKIKMKGLFGEYEYGTRYVIKGGS